MPPCREEDAQPALPCSDTTQTEIKGHNRVFLPTSDENGFLRLTAASETESHPVIIN